MRKSKNYIYIFQSIERQTRTSWKNPIKINKKHICVEEKVFYFLKKVPYYRLCSVLFLTTFFLKRYYLLYLFACCGVCRICD